MRKSGANTGISCCQDCLNSSIKKDIDIKFIMLYNSIKNNTLNE